MIRPVMAWEWIAAARRGVAFILLAYLLPLLFVIEVCEGYGLTRWGRQQGTLDHPKIFPVGETVVFEALRFVLWLLVVFITAKLVKSVGETFHGRHTFRQTFTLVAYGLSPVLVFRLLDLVPGLSPWVGWGIGVLFAFKLLYHGVPRVMDPDPPQAFGLYVMTAVLVLIKGPLIGRG